MKTYDELKQRVDQIKVNHSGAIARRWGEYMAQYDPEEYARHPEWHINATVQTDQRFPKHSEKAIAAAFARVNLAREAGVSDVNAAVDEWVASMRRELAYKPEDVTDDARLLNGPVTLTSTDLRAIIDRDPENVTMRRMVTEYAHKLHIPLPEGYAADIPDYLARQAENLREQAVHALKTCTEPVPMPQADAQAMRAAFGLKAQ